MICAYVWSLNGTLDAGYCGTGRLTITVDGGSDTTAFMTLQSTTAQGIARRARVGYADGTWLAWNSNTPHQKGRYLQIEFMLSAQGEGYETPRLAWAELSYTPLSIGVSAQVLNAISKLRRRRTHGRVVIDYTDPMLDQSVKNLANEYGRISHVYQTSNRREDPTQKWASLDGTWTLDGTWHLPPEDAEEARLLEMGWWGETLSADDGTFGYQKGRIYGDSNPILGNRIFQRVKTRPMLQTVFSARPVRNFKVIGDSKRGEYPVEFVIRVWSNTGVLLHTETVTNNSVVKWRKNIAGWLNVGKITLEILKWSHPHRVTKVIEFFTSVQVTYEGKDLFLIHLLEEREVEGATLPVGNISANEVDIQLNNVDRVFDPGNTQSSLSGLVKVNRKIRPYLGVELDDGTVEWLPMGVFWSGDWRAPEDDIIAETSGRDRLELLRKSTYSKSQVLMNPADVNHSDTTDADWQAGTLDRVKADNGDLILNIGA